MKVIIVGGVAGGASAAARLRRLDENAQIILLERGGYISFANCGLPYYIGGVIKEKSSLTLQTPQGFGKRFNIDVRINSQVTAIDSQAKTVTVSEGDKTYSESYDKLILSPGAEPVRPPIEGVNSPRVFTLRNIPDTLRIDEFIKANKPQKAVIVGGGPIGIEMAENLAEKGIAVTIVEMLDQLLTPLDYDMACNVHNYIRTKGVEVLLGAAVKKMEDTGSQLLVSVGDEGRQIAADLLILSIGVRPESGLAKDAGLEMGQRGMVAVDDGMQTSDPDIYAVGDVIEVNHFVTGQKAAIQLAGPANRQGRIAADNICGLNSRYTGTQGSSILKVFDMTVASTGINEKTAKALGLDYEKSFTFSANHAGYYPGGRDMNIKVIFDKQSGRILGAQVVGFEGSDKRCDVLATAIRFGATAGDLTRLELCYAPPYSSAKDPVNMAGFAIENILAGRVKVFHWHDIAGLPRDGSVQLLDTREKAEFAAGSIPDFINIPLDELREHINELDPAKPVYVHCLSGMRSYVACRILAQKGFDCYNLSGGYRQYTVVHPR